MKGVCPILGYSDCSVCGDWRWNPMSYRMQCDSELEPVEKTCYECCSSRPNGCCVNDLCTHDEICDNFEQMAADHKKTCDCGWWSCITRGCGSCPDCEGEHCECDM